MAKTPKTFEPDAEYRVKLSRPVSIVPGRTLRPLNEQTFNGAFLQKIVDREGSDVIDTAERV